MRMPQYYDYETQKNRALQSAVKTYQVAVLNSVTKKSLMRALVYKAMCYNFYCGFFRVCGKTRAFNRSAC